jgi:ABC-type branched-subunit amino acid transport system substrate-binding protein
MSYTQLQQYNAFVPKDLLFAGVPFLAGLAPTKQAQDAQKDFFGAFTSAGVRPDFLYSTSWDPALIAIAALRSIGPDATASQLKSFIEGLHGFNGVAGEYDFRDGGQRGLTQRNVVIMRWDAAKVGWVAVSQLGGLPLR